MCNKQLKWKNIDKYDDVLENHTLPAKPDFVLLRSKLKCLLPGRRSKKIQMEMIVFLDGLWGA